MILLIALARIALLCSEKDELSASSGPYFQGQMSPASCKERQRPGNLLRLAQVHGSKAALYSFSPNQEHESP